MWWITRERAYPVIQLLYALFIIIVESRSFLFQFAPENSNFVAFFNNTNVYLACEIIFTKEWHQEILQINSFDNQGYLILRGTQF
jgi:hypothetical protein